MKVLRLSRFLSNNTGVICKEIYPESEKLGNLYGITSATINDIKLEFNNSFVIDNNEIKLYGTDGKTFKCLTSKEVNWKGSVLKYYDNSILRFTPIKNEHTFYLDKTTQDNSNSFYLKEAQKVNYHVERLINFVNDLKAHYSTLTNINVIVSSIESLMIPQHINESILYLNSIFTENIIPDFVINNSKEFKKYSKIDNDVCYIDILDDIYQNNDRTKYGLIFKKTYSKEKLKSYPQHLLKIDLTKFNDGENIFCYLACINNQILIFDNPLKIHYNHPYHKLIYL